MAATTGEHAPGCLWIGQLAQRISLDSGGIDDHPSGPALLQARLGFADGGLETPIGSPLESHHSAAGAQGGAPLFGGACQQQI